MRQSRDSLALSSNESSSPTSPPEALTIARKCSKTSKQVEQDTGIWETFNSAAATPRFDSHALSRAAVLCRSTGTQSQKILSELEKWIVNNQHSGGRYSSLRQPCTLPRSCALQVDRHSEPKDFIRTREMDRQQPAFGLSRGRPATSPCQVQRLPRINQQLHNARLS